MRRSPFAFQAKFADIAHACFIWSVLLVAVVAKKVPKAPVAITAEQHTYMTAGNQALHAGDLAAAVAAYERVELAGPAPASVINNLGVAYSKSGRQLDALKAYQRVELLNPDDPNAWLNTGASFMRLERYEEAIGRLQKAHRLRPAHVATIYSLGKAYKHVGDTKQARFMLKATARMGLSTGQVDVVLAGLVPLSALYAEIDNRSDLVDLYIHTIALCEQTGSVKQGCADTAIRLGSAYQAEGRFHEAQTVLQRALAKTPDDFALTTALGSLLLSHGDVAGSAGVGGDHSTGRIGDPAALAALPYLRRAVDLNSSSVVALNNLALALRRSDYSQGKEGLQESLAVCTEALRLAPDSASIANVMGNTLDRLDRVEEAESAFQRAATLDPLDPAPVRNLARMALLRDGPGSAQDDAVAYFRQAAVMSLRATYQGSAMVLNIVDDWLGDGASTQDDGPVEAVLSQTAVVAKEGESAQSRAAQAWGLGPAASDRTSHTVRVKLVGGAACGPTTGSGGELAAGGSPEVSAPVSHAGAGTSCDREHQRELTFEEKEGVVVVLRNVYVEKASGVITHTTKDPGGHTGRRATVFTGGHEFLADFSHSSGSGDGRGETVLLGDRDGAVASVLQAHLENHYHFTAEGLVRLLLLLHAYRDPTLLAALAPDTSQRATHGRSLRLLVPEKHGRFHQALQLLGIDPMGPRVIHYSPRNGRRYHVETLVVADWRRSGPHGATADQTGTDGTAWRAFASQHQLAAILWFPPAWGLRLVRRVMNSATASTTKKAKRSVLYLSRQRTQNRAVVGEELLLHVLASSLLSAAGGPPVEVFDTDRFPTLSDQIGLFSTAAVVVAPHGASMANIVYCQPGTTVVELPVSSVSHRVSIPFYEHMAAALELNMVQVASLSSRFNGHYVVDEASANDVASAVLAALCAEPTWREGALATACAPGTHRGGGAAAQARVSEMGSAALAASNDTESCTQLRWSASKVQRVTLEASVDRDRAVSAGIGLTTRAGATHVALLVPGGLADRCDCLALDDVVVSLGNGKLGLSSIVGFSGNAVNERLSVLTQLSDLAHAEGKPGFDLELGVVRPALEGNNGAAGVCPSSGTSPSVRTPFDVHEAYLASLVGQTGWWGHPRLHFATFGEGERYAEAAHSLCQQARASSWFHHVRCHNLATLEPTFLGPSQRTFIERNQRGVGYWIWKPALILQELSDPGLREGDILWYSDGRAALNPLNGQLRLQEYLALVGNATGGLLVFQMPHHLEKHWTKAAAARALGLHDASSDDLNTGQIHATNFFVRKCPEAIATIQKWEAACHARDGRLVDDSETGADENGAGFESHRHDQSLFSLVVKSVPHEVCGARYDGASGVGGANRVEVPCRGTGIAVIPRDESYGSINGHNSILKWAPLLARVGSLPKHESTRIAEAGLSVQTTFVDHVAEAAAAENLRQVARDAKRLQWLRSDLIFGGMNEQLLVGLHTALFMDRASRTYSQKAPPTRFPKTRVMMRGAVPNAGEGAVWFPLAMAGGQKRKEVRRANTFVSRCGPPVLLLSFWDIKDVPPPHAFPGVYVYVDTEWKVAPPKKLWKYPLVYLGSRPDTAPHPEFASLHVPYLMQHFAERTCAQSIPCRPSDMTRFSVPSVSERVAAWQKRPYLVAYMANQCYPHREKLFDDLTAFAEAHPELGPANALGKCHGSNPKYKAARRSTRFDYLEADGSGGGNTTKLHYLDESVELYSQYKFVVSLENHRVSGYMTEKIVNGFLGGAVPLYWGDNEMAARVFNPASFISIEAEDGVGIKKATPEVLKRILRISTNVTETSLAMSLPPLSRQSASRYFELYEEDGGTGRGSNSGDEPDPEDDGVAKAEAEATPTEIESTRQGTLQGALQGTLQGMWGLFGGAAEATAPTSLPDTAAKPPSQATTQASLQSRVCEAVQRVYEARGAHDDQRTALNSQGRDRRSAEQETYSQPNGQAAGSRGKKRKRKRKRKANAKQTQTQKQKQTAAV